MFYCALHNWYSTEEPCKACFQSHVTVTTNKTILPETGIPTLDRQDEEKSYGFKENIYTRNGERLYTEKEVLQREEDAFNAGRSGYSTYDHYHFHFLNFSDYKNKK